jgi:hypothetical protein
VTSDLGVGTAEIATTTSGNVVVVWSQFSSLSPLVSDVVAAGCSIATGECSGAIPLESDTAGGWDIDPHIAINESDAAFAVWRRFDLATNTFSLRANRGGSIPWSSTPTEIESFETSVDASPAVAVDKIGNAIVIWAQKVGAQPNERTTAYANRFSTATGWGLPARLESDNRANDFFTSQRPQVAFDFNDNAIGVWQSGMGVITGAIYSSGAWEVDKDVGNGSSGVSRDPQIVVENGHTAVTVFIQDSGPASMPSIFVSRFQ